MFEILSCATVNELQFEVLEFHSNASNAYPLKIKNPQNNKTNEQ